MVVVTLARQQKRMSEKKTGILGILAFDTGKTMCRLVSLYNSLSDKEISRLHQERIKSKGIAYMISHQECFLLNLAAVELLGDLDAIGATISRLGRKCSDTALSRFDLVYNDLKLGVIDLRKLDYCSKSAQKIINKMEKLVTATGNLYSAMESLVELEASEKKMQRLRTVTITYTNTKNINFPKPNLDYFIEKVAFQRKQVQQYKESSLWNQTVDKTVGIMAKIVCIVYARICSVFGSYFSHHHTNHVYCLIEHRVLYQTHIFLSDQFQGLVQKRGTKSGPIFKTTKLSDIRFYSAPIKPGTATKHHSHASYEAKRISNDRNSTILKFAPSWTVGGVGLAMRYAKVILFAERCLHAPVGKEAREELYGMLPERVRAKVRAKLKGRWRKGEKKREEGELAIGWREAVEEMMEWLSPMAHDTVRWHEERMMEKKGFEVKKRALLLQTLHYSDLEKAEAAIVEVLVGLSCIYRYEKS